LQLRKQQNDELKHNLNLLGACKTKVRTLQHPEKAGEWKVIRKKVIKRIKHKHKIQRMQLKNLRKKGKKDELNRKLNSWKKSGFKMIEAEKEIKNVSGTNVRKQIENFKKQGYNVGFLNKKGKI
jgi:hypothetical protein